MIWFVCKAVLSHWRRRPWQLVTVIAGLSMATALWSGVQAINAEARAAYEEAAQLSRISALPMLAPDPDRPLELRDFADLRRAGWNVSPVLRGNVPTPRGPIEVIGIDPLSHPLGARLISEGAPTEGIGNLALAIAAPATARTLNGTEEFPPVQADPRLPRGQLIADIAIVAGLLDEPFGISQLAVIGEVPATLPTGYKLTPAPDVADVRGLTDSFHLNLTAFGGLAFVVGLFILHGGIGLAIEQRRGAFRTMRAVGVPMKSLLLALSAELLVISFVAGAIGVLLGYWIAIALLPGVSLTLGGLYGVPAPGVLELRGEWVVAGFALALIGAATAGADALRRIAKLPVLAPAMPRSWARHVGGAARRRAIVGVCLVILGSGVGVASDSLIASFVMVAGVLLGVALAAPFVLDRLLSGCGRLANGPATRWFWSDTRMQLPGLSLALMALLLALAANIGVNTMVASFRQAFTGFLDQRLVSDLYVRVPNTEVGVQLTAYLNGQGLDVLPIFFTKKDAQGWPYEIYGIADHPIYENNWPMIDQTAQTWEELRSGAGVLMSEQMAREQNLSLGDDVALPDGPPLAVTGIYADYGNPTGQVVMDLDAFNLRYLEAERLRFGVLSGSNDPELLAAGLVKALDLNPRSITEVATMRAASLAIFERTFAVTASLNVLTLGVAGFAMLTSLLTLSAVRLPQLAPVWSVGTTRGFLARAELLRAFVLTLLTFVLSLPLGLALAWILLTKVNAAAFGWRLPMDVFPMQWLVLAGVALLATLLSVAFPAIRLARTHPATLTQVFARER